MRQWEHNRLNQSDIRRILAKELKEMKSEAEQIKFNWEKKRNLYQFVYLYTWIKFNEKCIF